MGVLGRFFVVYSLVVSVCGVRYPVGGCNCMNVEVMDRCLSVGSGIPLEGVIV